MRFWLLINKTCNSQGVNCNLPYAFYSLYIIYYTINIKESVISRYCLLYIYIYIYMCVCVCVCVCVQKEKGGKDYKNKYFNF